MLVVIMRFYHFHSKSVAGHWQNEVKRRKKECEEQTTGKRPTQLKYSRRTYALFRSGPDKLLQIRKSFREPTQFVCSLLGDRHTLIHWGAVPSWIDPKWKQSKNKNLYQFGMDMIWHVSREKWVIKNHGMILIPMLIEFEAHRIYYIFRSLRINRTAHTPEHAKFAPQRIQYSAAHVQRERSSCAVGWASSIPLTLSLFRCHPNESWRIRFCLTLPMNCVKCDFGIGMIEVSPQYAEVSRVRSIVAFVRIRNVRCLWPWPCQNDANWDVFMRDIWMAIIMRFLLRLAIECE